MVADMPATVVTVVVSAAIAVRRSLATAILRQAQDRLAVQVFITAHRIAVTATLLATKVQAQVSAVRLAARALQDKLNHAAPNAASAMHLAAAMVAASAAAMALRVVTATVLPLAEIAQASVVIVATATKHK